MKKLIVGNWKMQKLFSQIHPYFKVFKHKFDTRSYDFGLAVPSLHIRSCLEEMVNTPFVLGAQNVSEHDLGAYTGEVAASQLASMPITFCLVGHSERRKHFHESSDLVIKKAKQLQNNGILPIVCIGETLEQKPQYQEVLKEQLKQIFSLDPKKLVIAYEPVWAIGTGQTATIDDIQRVHRYIKSYLKDHSYDFSLVPILYGGSVTEANAASIVKLDEVGGLLIGGASLDPEAYEKLLTRLD